MISGNYQGLAALGEVGTTQQELIKAGTPFFVALYSQRPGTSMESARFKLFMKKKKQLKLMA